MCCGSGLPRWLSSEKNLPAKQETHNQSLGREDPLKKEIATHYSILGLENPRDGEPDGLPSMGSYRVGHD